MVMAVGNVLSISLDEKKREKRPYKKHLLSKLSGLISRNCHCILFP